VQKDLFCHGDAPDLREARAGGRVAAVLPSNDTSAERKSTNRLSHGDRQLPGPRSSVTNQEGGQEIADSGLKPRYRARLSAAQAKRPEGQSLRNRLNEWNEENANQIPGGLHAGTRP
jgi:hypothetical protein